MLAMYKPHGGKLTYHNDRVVAIFSHYNHFGLKSDNVTRDDHTGDTTFSFGIDGKDNRCSVACGSSHSLI